MSDKKLTTNYEGGCFCGKIRYRMTAEPFNVCFCHCKSCRRASGGASVPWASVARTGFEFLNADPARYNSSDGVVRTFCARCGSSLTYEQTEADSMDIALATLDEPDSLKPSCHIWVSDKPSWDKISDGLPEYSEWRSTSKQG